MNDEIDPLLLGKWVADRLDREERERLTEWLAAHPDRAAQLEELREVWRLADGGSEVWSSPHDPAEAARWAAIKGKLQGIGLAAQVPQVTPSTRTIAFPFVRRRTPMWSWATAAAAAVLLVAGGVAWFAADRRKSETAEAAAPMRVYETARGERAEFRLRDGTRVMLSVASRLRVPASFGERGSARW